jgi:hypothetical protein
LERQNGTAQSRNRYQVRKTYAFAKLVAYMDEALLQELPPSYNPLSGTAVTFRESYV